MRAFALQWFAQMQAGKIDRTEYTAEYGAQLTDAAVQAMSHQLNQYGASPLRAEIMHFWASCNWLYLDVSSLALCRVKIPTQL
jgi:hypothetical protein